MFKNKFNIIAFLLPFALLAVLFIFDSCVQEYKNDKNAIIHKYTRNAPRMKLNNVRNASGLTFCNDTNTVFVVQDSPSKIIEINYSGQIIRKIKLNDMNDIEGITYLGNNRFAIVEESTSTIYFVSIKHDTKEISKQDTAPLHLKIPNNNHEGLSGITYDPENKALFVITEKNPKSITKIFIGSEKQETPWDLEKTDIKDASGIAYDSTTKHLFIVSKTSKNILELTSNGKVLAKLPLTKGYSNLKRTLKKPEGISIDSKNRRFFICGEKNEFYIFAKNPIQEKNLSK